MATAKEFTEEKNDVEFILNDIGGSFGKFQIFNYALFAVPIFLANFYYLDYVFSSLNLDYRCRIPECDLNTNADFNPHWLENAVPFVDSKPSKCMRYESIMDNRSHFCDASAFNRSSVVKCSSDELIYRTDEVSILNEFNITCEETNWKLSMVGVTNSFAKFVFLPIIGQLSDRFGRVPMIITCALGYSIFKFISSYSTSLGMFLLLTFFDAGFGSGLHPLSVVLGIEWATADKRILVSTLTMCLNPFGPFLLAFIASQTHNFKLTLRLVSLPGLLLIAYVWLARDSLRWYLTKKKYDRAMEVVQRAAKMNKITPSQRTLGIILAKCELHESAKDERDANTDTLTTVLQSPQMFVRLLICICGWIGIIFVWHGVGIAAVSLPGDKYWNFAMTQSAVAPAIIISYFTLTHLGRKWSLCSSTILAGVTIILSHYVNEIPAMKLILFFAGSICIRHALQVLYLYTGELWPTSVRTTMITLCSMCGRFGSIIAPMTPMLADYSIALPYYLFFGASALIGLSFLLLPETFNTKLPDTIEEAKLLGKFSGNKVTSHSS